MDGMRELPLGAKRLEDGKEWRTPQANFSGQWQRHLGARGLGGRKNETGGGRRETVMLLTSLKSHVRSFDVSCRGF
jgi:hypothetical protein